VVGSSEYGTKFWVALNAGISSLAKTLLASQEGLCFMKLVS